MGRVYNEQGERGNERSVILLIKMKNLYKISSKDTKKRVSNDKRVQDIPHQV